MITLKKIDGKVRDFYHNLVHMPEGTSYEIMFHEACLKIEEIARMIEDEIKKHEGKSIRKRDDEPESGWPGEPRSVSM